MIRRISTKWMLAVLLAVVTPFLGYAFFVDRKMAERLSGDVVQQYLLSMAADLADRIDSEIDERRLDAETQASDAIIKWYLDEDPYRDFEAYVKEDFDDMVRRSRVYDLIVAIDAKGQFRISNDVDGQGGLYSQDVLDGLREHDFSTDEWFREALTSTSGLAMVDQHRSPLLPQRGAGTEPRPEDYHIGFAHRVNAPESDLGAGPVGVVYFLMSWTRIQNEVTDYHVPHVRGGNARAPELLARDIYASSYAWIWKSDADTILAHPKHELYGLKVSQPPIDLPQMVEAARASPYGMYPDYSFRGVAKKAAFQRCKDSANGGFGWVVGVGVDEADIYAPVRELSKFLYGATAFTLFLAVLLTAVIARRTTRPILELRRHTERIAGGDLDARIDVRSSDELGDLARAFNQMTALLKENRAQLVRAEKDAAWREMARQVAHEIKNPLTPISLAVGLLKRARSERPSEFDAIFERTTDMIGRQVDHMRDIAKDFHALAGRHVEPRIFEAAPVVREVLDLEAAWASEQGVRVVVRCEDAKLRGDPDELRRALINLVSNALEAMPTGGELEVSLSVEGERVVLIVGDTGSGISDVVRERLFEPYFTTRSAGTGLGLAIVRRIVEDMGGSVTLTNRVPGPGAIARIELARSA
jgi:signal transduction histidine kinase